MRRRRVQSQPAHRRPPSSPPWRRSRPTRLTPTQVFAAISPSVAFVDLPDSSGSGFLIDGGYLVTNAHVVWPYTEARVVFPDGSEHKDVPVVNWDLLADLAVLGPVETKFPPLALADGEGLPIGSEVYLIGYPGEVEKHPQPTLTRGVISTAPRVGSGWDDLPANGRPVLRRAERRRAGFGPRAGDRHLRHRVGVSFAMVASAADLAPRITRLIAGEDTSGLGDRRWQFEDERDRARVRTGQQPSCPVLRVAGAGRYGSRNQPERQRRAHSRGAYALGRTAGRDRTEQRELTQPSPSPHPTNSPWCCEVRSLADSPQDVSLSSSAELYPQDDPDDGRTIEPKPDDHRQPGLPRRPATYYNINLNAGDEIETRGRGAAVCSPCVDRLPGAAEGVKALAPSKDALGDSWDKWTYRAPHTGRYFLVVENEGDIQNPGLRSPGRKCAAHR